MKEFNLSEWLKDKSRKVVTRDGRPVNILKYDAITPMYPVIVSIIREDGVEIPSTYTKEGHDNVECLMHNEKNDLFFADKEEELTEFEKMLRYVLECYSGHEFASKSEIDTLKLNAKTLLDLARKELEKEYRLCYKDESNWEAGWNSCHKDLIQNLPKWKKATEDKDFDRHVLLLEDDRVVISSFVYEDEYYIELNDLRTLPKEE